MALSTRVRGRWGGGADEEKADVQRGTLRGRIGSGRGGKGAATFNTCRMRKQI